MPGRRRNRPEEKKGLDIWVMTYGDMMSLLLVFFILLVSFSTIQESKFSEAAASLRGAFGMTSYPPTSLRLPELATSRELARQRQEAVSEVRKLERTLLDNGLDREVDIEVGQGGIAIRMNAPFLFASGRAELRGEAEPLLAQLAQLLAGFTYPVRVEGHTDSVPIHTALFASNWELSAARAVAVARALERAGLKPARLSAAGCGEHRPLAGNDTEEGRARNRRVEIMMEWPR